jgi:hypothetical protein
LRRAGSGLDLQQVGVQPGIDFLLTGRQGAGKTDAQDDQRDGETRPAVQPEQQRLVSDWENR